TPRPRGRRAAAVVSVRHVQAGRGGVPRRLEPAPRNGTRLAALRERLRAAAGPARRGRRGGDLPARCRRRAAADDLRGRQRRARLRVRRRGGPRDPPPIGPERGRLERRDRIPHLGPRPRRGNAGGHRPRDRPGARRATPRRPAPLGARPVTRRARAPLAFRGLARGRPPRDLALLLRRRLTSGATSVPDTRGTDPAERGATIPPQRFPQLLPAGREESAAAGANIDARWSTTTRERTHSSGRGGRGRSWPRRSRSPRLSP